MFKTGKLEKTNPTFMIAAVLMVLTLGSLSDSYAQNVARQHSALYRVTLVVSDIEQSIDFYDRLGLIAHSDISRTSNDAAGIVSRDSFPLTDDPTRSRLVVMGGDGSASGSVALLWYDRPPLPSARGNLMGLGTGDIVMMFQVPDVQAVYNRLASINTRFHEPPTRFTGPGPTGDGPRGPRLLAYDPDGHMVEITQID